jgi:hypothetical protein
MNIHAAPVSAASSGTLTGRALVGSVTVSQWSGRKLDKEVTAEVHMNHNAQADAGNYNKLIVPKDALAGIVTAVGAIRSGFAARTLPWKDNGDRIFAAHKLFDIRQWFQGAVRNYEDEVEKMLVKYPTYINQRQSELGTLFKPEDYPTTGELRRKFGASMSLRPVESGADLRVNMSEEQRQMIAEEIEANVREQTRQALGSAYSRVAEAVGRMVERLNAYKPATKPGERSENIFKDSLVGNIEELIKVLPALNITDDPVLTKLAVELSTLVQYDAQTLRKNELVRKDTAAEAQRILDQLNDYL